MADPDVHGPIDYVVIEFPEDAIGTDAAREIADLVDHGTVRLWDLLVVHKAADGSCVEVDLAAPDARLGGLRTFAGARSGLLGGNDIQEAGEVMEPGSVAVVLLYENTWAVPFVAASRSESGEMVATARLTAQQIMDALDAVESAD